MSSSSTSIARGSSLYRPYSRSTSTGSVSSVENLPPRTIARVSKEIRDLMKKPPGGISLVVDPETGMPASLGEIVVSPISRTGRVCSLLVSQGRFIQICRKVSSNPRVR